MEDQKKDLCSIDECEKFFASISDDIEESQEEENWKKDKTCNVAHYISTKRIINAVSYGVMKSYRRIGEYECVLYALSSLLHSLYMEFETARAIRGNDYVFTNADTKKTFSEANLKLSICDIQKIVKRLMKQDVHFMDLVKNNMLSIASTQCAIANYLLMEKKLIDLWVKEAIAKRGEKKNDSKNK